MNPMQFAPYFPYAALAIGVMCILTFLLISIPESRGEIARLRKVNAPSERIAKEAMFAMRYLLIGTGILLTASYALSAHTA